MKCLVLSECAIPLPDRTRAEGGGLRAWGLATGLQAWAGELTVTIAYPDDGRGSPSFHAGVGIETWSPASLPALIRSFDSIVVSYCAINLAPAVVAALAPSQQLVLDCNVPFYVEVSARESKSVGPESASFAAAVEAIGGVLRRGDLFLCASERQKTYYQGVLSAVGRINPATYGTDLLELAPYGIPVQPPSALSRPIDALTGRPNSVKLLWFGALYPWFDIADLLEAVALLNERSIDVTLTVVGARNPASNHPDFLAKVDAFDAMVRTPRHAANVYTQDWVSFDVRADWYLNADLGVTINKPGLENFLAWRTRLVDLVWGRVPMATNGGDPLGDALLAGGGAIPLRIANALELAEDLQIAIERTRDSGTLRANLERIRSTLFWDVVTQGLARRMTSGARAADLQQRFLVAGACDAATASRSTRPRIRNLPRHLARHGLVSALRQASRYALRRLTRRR